MLAALSSESGDGVTGASCDSPGGSICGNALTLPTLMPASCNASIALPRGCPVRFGITYVGASAPTSLVALSFRAAAFGSLPGLRRCSGCKTAAPLRFAILRPRPCAPLQRDSCRPGSECLLLVRGWQAALRSALRSARPSLKRAPEAACGRIVALLLIIAGAWRVNCCSDLTMVWRDAAIHGCSNYQANSSHMCLRI